MGETTNALRISVKTLKGRRIFQLLAPREQGLEKLIFLPTMHICMNLQ
jgi:hypothetical protein